MSFFRLPLLSKILRLVTMMNKPPEVFYFLLLNPLVSFHSLWSCVQLDLVQLWAIIIRTTLIINSTTFWFSSCKSSFTFLSLWLFSAYLSTLFSMSLARTKRFFNYSCYSFYFYNKVHHRLSNLFVWFLPLIT